MDTLAALMMKAMAKRMAATKPSMGQSFRHCCG
jgi:hypothetical protein